MCVGFRSYSLNSKLNIHNHQFFQQVPVLPAQVHPGWQSQLVQFRQEG